MLYLKGFVTIAQYINNQPGTVSPIGELSTWSLTYTKERGEYSNLSIPGFKLHTFKSIDELNNPIVVDDNQVLQIFQIVQECINYAAAHIIPYNQTDFRNDILGTFFNKISDLEIDEFINNGSVALPEYISWTSTQYSNNSIKIWLADNSFQNQYDNYEIEVIAPIDNLDDFFGFYNQAVTKVEARTLTDLMNQIQTVKDIYPETYLRLYEFDYINKDNTAQKTSTTWAVLVYGKAGDQIDIIKDALINYILTHSNYVRQDWAIIFPSIFRRTEFTILPRWDKLSIPNAVPSASLYSSLIDPVEAVNFSLANIPFYPSAWIQENITIFPFDYKAIMLLSINGNDNIDGYKTLYGLFSDYIPVSSTSLDFNRMTVATREWALLLEQLLIVAETMTEFSTIPNNFRRVMRNDILFISVLYNNVDYLVAAKKNTFYQGN